MKEENATSIEYFRDLARVADLLNSVIFHGKQQEKWMIYSIQKNFQKS